MSDKKYPVYSYRWIVLAVFMFVNLTIQILWISYAPITSSATDYYGVDDLAIGLLAMSFMIAFIPLSIPASWVIDTYGFRRGVGLGVVLMAAGGLARGLAGSSYAIVLVGTIAAAVAQPFLLNAWTKVPANWFAMEERATAVGLVTLSNLVGTAIGMALTPVLADSLSIPTIQLIYGGVTALSAVLFLIYSREKPPTPPCPPDMEARALMLDGLKNALHNRTFGLYLLVSFIGIGIFNGINTWIEGIVRLRGFSSTDAGTLGAVMLVGGVLGAVIIPPFSDKQHKRQPYLLLGILLSIPGLIGLTFFTAFGLLIASAFILGFFLVSTLPIGMQYAAEITYPTPEGTSNGLIQLFGQGSVVFVLVLDVLNTSDDSFTPSLVLAILLLLMSAGVITRLKDPSARFPPNEFGAIKE
ncbi:MAG TPA: MFS transporter [Aggregatilineaceae bacterium]|nr:MFS transporter [Aggregatilineaceae bacterium]